MGLGISEIVGLAKASHQLGVALQYFVKELTVVDVVASLVLMTVS